MIEFWNYEIINEYGSFICIPAWQYWLCLAIAFFVLVTFFMPNVMKHLEKTFGKRHSVNVYGLEKDFESWDLDEAIAQKTLELKSLKRKIQRRKLQLKRMNEEW